ncbi:unnamed protein product [Prunus brigantina]
MGDSQQGNNKGKGKEKENYESWTMDDTNELLHLLVDAINSGLRDANGSLSKQNSHPSHSKLREKSVVDYEDLKIVVGGGTATGNGSIALGADDTDATTYGEENRDFGMEDFSYDPNNDAFIAPNHYEPSYQPPSPRQCTIGAIDGTHIPAMVRGRDVSSYRNRHGKISQNVLAACNFDLEFMYVLSGWEGSAHDSKLLHDALSRRNGLKVPQGKYFLVDCGFPNRRQFLAPFRGVRYHLQDFAGHGNDPQNENELFNLRHASLRNVIERIFGIFKSRFTIFKSAPPFPFKTQAELVLACVALHNFLRKECRSDEFPIEPVDESSSSSVLPS